MKLGIGGGLGPFRAGISIRGCGIGAGPFRMTGGYSGIWTLVAYALAFALAVLLALVAGVVAGVAALAFGIKCMVKGEWLKGLGLALAGPALQFGCILALNAIFTHETATRQEIATSDTAGRDRAASSTFHAW